MFGAIPSCKGSARLSEFFQLARKWASQISWQIERKIVMLPELNEIIWSSPDHSSRCAVRAASCANACLTLSFSQYGCMHEKQQEHVLTLQIYWPGVGHVNTNPSRRSRSCWICMSDGAGKMCSLKTIRIEFKK